MKKLIIILFLIWGCDYAPTEHTHDSAGVEIDWILIKCPNWGAQKWNSDTEEYTYYSGIGYIFLGKVTNHNFPNYYQEGFEGIITFQYEGESFSFDISDSYNINEERYLFDYSTPEYVENIKCFNNMSYCEHTYTGAAVYKQSIASPFEVVDYR